MYNYDSDFNNGVYFFFFCVEFIVMKIFFGGLEVFVV